MISQLTKCVCDYCGDVEYFLNFKTATYNGWYRRVIRGEAMHFCSEKHLIMFETKEE